MEPFIGTSINDKRDDQSFNQGLRLSYLVVDETDAIWTVEAAASFDWIMGAEKPKPKSRKHFEGALVFQEIYNPMAFRILAGAGTEWRRSEWSSVLLFRGGLGWYPSQAIGLWTDLSARSMSENYPLEWTISSQFIF